MFRFRSTAQAEARMTGNLAPMGANPGSAEVPLPAHASHALSDTGQYGCPPMATQSVTICPLYRAGNLQGRPLRVKRPLDATGCRVDSAACSLAAAPGGAAGVASAFCCTVLCSEATWSGDKV